MKTVLTNSPSFAPGAAGAGTLNFSNTTGFALNRLFAVLNQTRNVIIYGATVSGKGYAAYNASTKVLTLSTDTSTNASGDSLVCIYDDPSATVALTGSLPAGTNTIGTVGLSAGAVVGISGTVPVSASALPLPTGAASETTLTSLRSLTAEQPAEQTTGMGALNAQYNFTNGGATSPQCQTITAGIASGYGFVGSIALQGSIDGTSWITFPTYNASTGLAEAMSTPGTAYQASVAGFYQLRFVVTAFTGGTAYVYFKRTNSPGKGAAVGVFGSVEISNDVGNPIPTTISPSSGQEKIATQKFALSITPQATTLSQAYLLGASFSADLADTGYSLEPCYVKIWANASAAPTVGSTAPSLTLCVSDGLGLKKDYLLPAPLQITGTNTAYIAMTRYEAASDATPVVATVAATLYTRAT